MRLLWLGALILAGPAYASDAKNDACVGAYERAQVALKSQKLVDAGVELQSCAANCPGALKRDCNKWLSEQARAVPSVEIDVRDAKGAHLEVHHVEVDGRPLASGQELSNLTLDPGTHAFRITVAGRDAVDLLVTVAASEKRRHVSVVFGPEKNTLVTKPIEPEPPKALAPPANTVIREKRVPVAAYVLGGVAIATLAVGAGLVIHGQLRRSDLAATCGTNGGCEESQLDSIRTEWLWGGISLGVGGLSVGAATLMFALTPSTPQSAPQANPIASTPYGVWITGTW